MFDDVVSQLQANAPRLKKGEIASAALYAFCELPTAEQARWIEQLRSRDLRPLIEASQRPAGGAEAIADEARAADAARAAQAARKRSHRKKRPA